jgi:hypothetical protein
MLRGIYLQYVKTQLEDRNEIVLILPYYETTDTVRLALSGEVDTYISNNFRYSRTDVSKHERDASLIIILQKDIFPQENGAAMIIIKTVISISFPT